MVAYFDVFPFAERIEFMYEQENWMVDDQYCCNPKCRCQEAVLSFFRLGEKMEKGPLQPMLSVSYEYPGAKAIRLEPEGDPRYSEHILLETLKKSRPDLDSLLARRQSLLRRLCDRSLKSPPFIRRSPKLVVTIPALAATARSGKSAVEPDMTRARAA